MNRKAPKLPVRTDTSPEIARKVRELVMAKTPEERLLMACSAFEAARQVVLSSLPPGLDEIEIKRALCERFYGEEVDVEGFIAHLKARRLDELS